MADPDLRSLTTPTSFSEELAEAEEGAVPFVAGGPTAEAWKPGSLRQYRPEPRHAIPTIDQDLGLVDAAPKPKGPKWRLNELRASARRLADMVPNEVERVRRRRAQWLGEL